MVNLNELKGIDFSTKYYDPRLLYRMSASNGLAAGNTYEEACVQGISEIFERYIQFQWYRTHRFEVCPRIRHSGTGHSCRDDR